MMPKGCFLCQDYLGLMGTSKNLAPASSALCADPSGKRSRSVILRCSSVSYLQVTSFRRALADPNDKRLCHRFEVLRTTLMQIAERTWPRS